MASRIFISLALALLTWGLRGQCVLSGNVYDASTGQTLPGANLFIPELQSGAACDNYGSFSLSSLPKGKFKLRASFIGYETAIIDLIISRDTLVHLHLYPSAVQANEIVITGGRPSAQHENAIKIESISSGKINKASSPTLVGSLSVVPGVDMIGRGEGVVTPVIRGLSTSNILMLNNGFRMENYQFSDHHPYLVDGAGIDRVEIIKGPASLLYGSDAIGGVINIVPEEPAVPSNLEGIADLKYYSNTQGISGSIGLKGTNNKWSWGFNGSGKNHADYLQGNGEYVPNSRFNAASAKAFTGHTGSRSTTRIGYEYQKQQLGMAEDEALPLITERGRKTEIWYQDLDHHFLSARTKLYYDRWKVSLSGAYQFSHRRLYGSDLSPEFKLVDMKLHTLLYEARTTFTKTDRSEFTLALQGMNQFNRNGEAPEHVLPDYSLNDLSLFGMVQHDFNRRWYIQVGLRFDNRFINVPEQEKAGHGHGVPDQGLEEDELLEELIRYYGNFSGSLGATYRITQDLLLRLNMASAYRTPNIAELTQDGTHALRYEQGNRNLQSQRNIESDLSMHYHKGFLMLDLGGFYNYILDYIHLSPTMDTTNDGNKIYRYLQQDARLYGLEAVAEVLPLKWLNILAGYSRVTGIQSDGENLPFIPQSKLRLETGFVWKKEKALSEFHFMAGTTIAFYQDHPSAYETPTPGYVLLYASAGAVFKAGSQKILLDVTANNLLNTDYIDHLSLLKDLGYYNMGRDLTVSLRIPFVISR